jgi:hypothetical protein
MLDTSIISELIRNPRGNAAKRIAKVAEDNICTSITLAAELRYGCAKSGSKRLLKAVEDLLASFPCCRSMSPPMPTTAESAPSWKRPEGRSAATTC